MWPWLVARWQNWTRRRTAGLGPPPAGHEPYSTAIAGVMFAERWQTVMECRLRDSVELRREPHNPHDANAIVVVTRQGRSLGHIGRRLAARLAPLMDRQAAIIPALITELISDISGQALGVKVSFFVPVDLLAEDPDSTSGARYFLDAASSTAVYLMIDCDEGPLEQIIRGLSEHGVPWLRHGVSVRPASNGRQYPWFVVFGAEVSGGMVDSFFTRHFPMVRKDESTEPLERWIGVFDSELQTLRAENAGLRQASEAQQESADQAMAEGDRRVEYLTTQVQTLQAALEQLDREREAAHARRIQAEARLQQAQRANVWEAIQVLLPNVDWVRDSETVVLNEILDRRPLLRLLYDLSGGNPVPMKRVRGTSHWSELHYNSGQHDDGRLYVRRLGSRWEILVSFKGGQVRDIDYLQRL